MSQIDQPILLGNFTPALSVKRWQPLALGVGLVGLAGALLGFYLDPAQFWRAYLLAYTFWLELALGCLGLVLLHHLVGGRWSALIRRLMETGAMTLPLLALLWLPLLLGLTTLYPWTDAEHVAHSELLQNKAGYLNLPFFIGRAVLYFAVWLTLAYLLNRWSLAQDQSANQQQAAALAARLRRLSALGMILFMLTTTFAAYDWLMSLEPEWFSSIYGLMFIIGAAVAGLALAIVGLRLLAGSQLQHKVWVKSFNDLGNFLLGFVMIWAYFAYSQFLVIWSANIPEEAIWYAHRTQGGWQYAGLVLIGLHFVLPFFLLLSRGMKRKAQWLTILALVILGARVLDLFWLIMPAFYPDGLYLHWLDPLLLLTMGGGWFALFIGLWTGRAPLPQRDPHLPAELV